MGRCPSCSGWNTLVESVVQDPTKSKKGIQTLTGSIPLREISLEDQPRISSEISELDRALGGGLVPGSLILLGGDPGIGKSTLVLQSLSLISAKGKSVLYVSGEESAAQIRMRAGRLGFGDTNLRVLCETSLKRIKEEMDLTHAKVAVVDSIQTLYLEELPGTPGSLSQIRECTLELMIQAKQKQITIIVIGHVTKDGQIAGPKTLEHMVDVVTYFEGDRNHEYRLLRCVKNRFGPLNEIGVFEMTSQGLTGISNPGKLFFRDRSGYGKGSTLSCTLEGTRPFIVEIQSLVSSTSYSVPQRVCLGVDPKKVSIILALLEKFAGIQIGMHDIFISLPGGLKPDDTALDLALALAIASNFLGRDLPEPTLFIGELGLSGEVREVVQLEARIKEAARLGVRQVILPAGYKGEKPKSVQLISVKTLQETVDFAFNQ
jgi:DNA repair protein RadA/Sms